MSDWTAILLRYRGGEVYAAGEHTGRGWLLTVCGVRLDVVTRGDGEEVSRG